MLDPTYVVMLNSRPRDDNTPPAGPWPAEVIVEDATGETSERTVTRLAGDTIVGPSWGGPHGRVDHYRIHAGDTTYHVQAHDVAGVVCAGDLTARMPDDDLLQRPEDVAGLPRPVAEGDVVHFRADDWGHDVSGVIRTVYDRVTPTEYRVEGETHNQTVRRTITADQITHVEKRED